MAWASDGWPVKTRWSAAAWFTVTAAVWVIATMGPAPTWAVAETVFPSALVELKVPVATPLELVLDAGCVRVFPVVGVADRTTAAPEITLLN